MATSSSSHIQKRPFQPSIDSYFNTQEADPNTPAPLQRTTSSPPLPHETQASLLSVGMRVRKSVPEGYKTHKTMGAQGFPVPSSAPPAATEPQPRIFRVAFARAFELTPFCGLHKTGGLAAQENPASSAPAAMETDEEDQMEDVPELTMSQSTLPSTQESLMSVQSTMGRKRSYEEEIEGEMDAYFDEVGSSGSNGLQVPQFDRPMARMRKSPRIAATHADDFDEAAFLTPPDGMDMDET